MWLRRVVLVAGVALLVPAASAQAKQVGSGTFATPVGPIDWRWQVHVKRWAPGKVRIRQVIHAERSFDPVPDNHSEWVVVPVVRGRLAIQTHRTRLPVIEDQFYPYDPAALVAWPINLSGIVTLANIRALELRYVYTHTQPATPGTTELVVKRPTSRYTVHGTRLKFWLVGAVGGGNGAVYQLRAVRGKVKRWKVLYRGAA